MDIDTLRILVDWKCNLSCSYCCNEQPQIREQIKPVSMKEINFTRYKVVCITGGEPLLFPLRVVAISQLARFSKAFVVLYTNGTFLNATMADMLMRAGVQAINVGLHEPKAFGQIIIY